MNHEKTARSTKFGLPFLGQEMSLTRVLSLFHVITFLCSFHSCRECGWCYLWIL